MLENFNKIITSIGSVLMAITASTCCIGPLMALAGMLGVSASSLIWLSEVKNYLITFSLVLIGFNLYRAYFPKKASSCCTNTNISINEKEQKAVSFFQSKKFLWSIALLTITIVLLPYLP